MTGHSGVSLNTFGLRAESAPAFQSGIFIYGPAALSIPLGNGILCVGSGALGFIVRLPSTQTDVSGTMSHTLDLEQPSAPEAAILAGSTWYFQACFRDGPAGGAGFNFSDGLEVSFLP